MDPAAIILILFGTVYGVDCRINFSGQNASAAQGCYTFALTIASGGALTESGRRAGFKQGYDTYNPTATDPSKGKVEDPPPRRPPTV